MDIHSEKKLDSSQPFCNPFPSDAIDGAFDNAYEDVSQPEWPPYPAELQNTFYSALQVGLTLLDCLECRGCDLDLITSTKWDRTG